MPVVFPVSMMKANLANSVLTYRGKASGDGSGTSISASIDIGTAAANRYVVVATGAQNSTAATVVVAGTSLTQLSISTDGGNARIFGGLVTTGSNSQTVTYDAAGSAFADKGFAVYTMTGLASTTPKQTAGGAALGAVHLDISGVAGDFVISSAYAISAAYTLGSSTQTVEANRNTVALGSGRYIGGAHATITATGTFHIGNDANEYAAATWA